MRNGKYKLWCMQGLCVLFIAFVFCLGSGFWSLSSASGEVKTVRVALYEGSPNLFTDASGEAAGFFADLLQEIASLEKWHLEYLPGTWSEGLERLQRGEVDLVTSLARTEERERRSTPTAAFPPSPPGTTAYVFPKSSISTLLDLRGKRVALLEGSVQHSGFLDFIRGFDLELTLLPVPEERVGFAMVSRGEAEAVLSVRTTGELYRSEYHLRETPIMFNAREAYYAASFGDPKGLLPPLDAHLKRMKEDPESAYYHILHRWFPQEPRGFLLPLSVRMGILGGLRILLCSLVVVVFLRWQIRRRTEELRKAKEVAESRNLRLQEEIRERERVQDILQEHEAHLEDLVSERTRDLQRINRDLHREIAERRQVEEKLSWKNEQLRRISDNLVEGFIYQVIRSPRGDFRRFLYASAGVTSILGIAPKDLYEDATVMYKRIHPEDLRGFRNEEERVLKNMETFLKEGRFSRSDGEVRWLRLSSIPHREKDGSIVWDGIAMDVTERKNWEEELRKSREQFKALAEHSEDVIMRFDREHRHLYVNPVASMQTGIPPEEFLGKTHQEMGFSQDLVQVWDGAIEEVFLTAKPGHMEFQFPEGNWMDWVLVPELSEEGEVVGVITSARNITERKMGEERIREIGFCDVLTGLRNRRYLEEENGGA